MPQDPPRGRYYIGGIELGSLSIIHQTRRYWHRKERRIYNMKGEEHRWGTLFSKVGGCKLHSGRLYTVKMWKKIQTCSPEAKKQTASIWRLWLKQPRAKLYSKVSTVCHRVQEQTPNFNQLFSQMHSIPLVSQLTSSIAAFALVACYRFNPPLWMSCEIFKKSDHKTYLSVQEIFILMCNCCTRNLNCFEL